MKEEQKESLNIAQANYLSDSERIEYLKDQWGVSELHVRGRLRQSGEFWWLTNVTTEDGTLLRYPLADFYAPLASKRAGVFVGRDSSIAPELRQSNSDVTALLTLARPHERTKHDNPLLVAADPESIEPLTSMLPARVFHNEDGSIAIEETVRQDYIAQCRAEVDTELAKLTEQIARFTKESDALAADLDETKRQHVQEQEALEAMLARQREVQQETQAIEQELAEAQKQRDRELGEIQSQAGELRAYVQARIEPLRRLELVTDAHWDALFPCDSKAVNPERSDWPVVDSETLPTDHIQRYLFGKGIGYPLDLLANFHALIGTGDLIILSGLSGSGKTNLVKSYADATDNEDRIIPVKPNWTSAEDLIGFHNPLQRAYAPTPFLEALCEAQRDPERLYIICLDEMNLARVEYYFADFLSRLENREAPSIDLYPDDEAGNVKTELRVLLQTLAGLNVDFSSASLESLLADCATMAGLAERLGLGDGESFAQLHGRIRRMLTGALTVPPRLSIPSNVRFVGAVNMDDTTHYLSPKVLDRAHVLQFQSPLDYWRQVSQALEGADLPQHGVRMPAAAFPQRAEYPAYDEADPLVEQLMDYGKEFLAPLGIELGMRPLRQAILYRNRLGEVFTGDGLELLALNNLLRQKVLPRFSFDGKQTARGRDMNRDAVVRAFRDRLVADLAPLESRDIPVPARAIQELDEMIQRASGNDSVYNYWA